MVAILFKIVKILKKEGKLSSYAIAKKLNETFQRVSYHLKELQKDGIVGKDGRKYYLLKTVFNFKGSIFIHVPETNKFMFESCEYYDGEECEVCGKDLKKGQCPKFEELPKYIQKLILNNKDIKKRK